MELERQFVPQCLQEALELDGPDELPLSNRYEDINSPFDVIRKFNGALTYYKGKEI